MAHAFISYVRENSEIVDRLASELRSRGIEVWLDRDDIKPGVYWKDAIKEAIQEGAFFIACYSKELNDRRETYMHGELGIAIDRLRQMPRNRVWFIPVFLNETKIPHHPISDRESLKDLHTTSLFKNWNGGIMEILGAMKLDDPIYRRVMHLSDLIRYHPTERHYATQQLAEIGPAAAEAVPALTEALRDSNVEVRWRAAEALGRIGPAAAEAVPALTEALRDSAEVPTMGLSVARGAEWALERIGLAAVPALTEALRNAEVRWSAAEVLGRIGPAAVPALTEALRDSNAEVRWRAAEALGRPAAAAAVPALTEALRDSDAEVRRRAAEALGRIGPAAAEAVPALTEALRDSDAVVRQRAVKALGEICPAAAVVPALTEALRDSNAEVRWRAVEVLGRIGPAAVPALTEALRGSNTEVCLRAVEALGSIGPAAAEALPALRKALRDYAQRGGSHSAIARAEYALQKITSRPLWLGD